LLESADVNTTHKFLSFRCTGCGNCCKEPLLPLTDVDLQRIVERTGDDPEEVVVWIDRWGIDMDDEPEAFVSLRQGRRVMVLRHQHSRCRYLGSDNRCTIYSSRPLGCRIYPFDPTFSRSGELRRLKVIHAVEECPYELDGKNDVATLYRLHERYEAGLKTYKERVAYWNSAQRRRKRLGRAAQTAREFLAFLGIGAQGQRAAALRAT
jgi:Fe-S-cluster containining protein